MGQENEELLDEFFHLEEDSFSDEVTQFGKLGEHKRASRYPFWVERYAKGEICIHLHHRIRSSDPHRECANCCAIFKRASLKSPLPYVQVNIAHSYRSEGRILQNSTGDMGSTVLVPVAESVQNPQGVSLGVINSTVRLQPLDHCLGIRGQAAHLVETAAPIRDTFVVGLEEFSSVLKDRELRTLRSVTRGQCSESVGQGVEAGSEVVTEISDDDLEFWRGTIMHLAGGNEGSVAGGARIELADNAVWLTCEEAFDFPLESFQMFVCPI